MTGGKKGLNNQCISQSTHVSIKIVLTATNDGKIVSHVFVPVTGASKDVSIQVTMLLPTEIVEEVLTFFFFFCY